MPPLWEQRRNLTSRCINLALQVYDLYNESRKREMIRSFANAISNEYSLKQLAEWEGILQYSINTNAPQRQNEKDATQAQTK